MFLRGMSPLRYHLHNGAFLGGHLLQQLHHVFCWFIVSFCVFFDHCFEINTFQEFPSKVHLSIQPSIYQPRNSPVWGLSCSRKCGAGHVWRTEPIANYHSKSGSGPKNRTEGKTTMNHLCIFVSYLYHPMWYLSGKWKGPALHSDINYQWEALEQAT